MTARKDEHICRLRANCLKFATDLFYICRNGKPQGFPSAGNDRPVLMMAGQKETDNEEKTVGLTIFIFNSGGNGDYYFNCNTVSTK